MKSLSWILVCFLVVHGRFDLDEVEEIAVKVGEKVEFEISANPSSGFVWRIVPDTSQKLFTHDLYGDFESEDPNLIGAIGKQVFYLKTTQGAKSNESVEMALNLQRPWNNEVVNTKYFTVSITG